MEGRLSLGSRKLKDILESFCRGKDPYSILITGLDNAGKSTIFQRVEDLVGFETAPLSPIIRESLTSRSLSLRVIDETFQHLLSNLIRLYFIELNANIHVIDGNDEERFASSASILQNLILAPKLADTKFLILVTKEDLTTTLTTRTIYQKLGFNQARPKFLRVQLCSMVDDSSLVEGLEWLSRMKAF